MEEVTFAPVGLDRDRMRAALRAMELDGMLLTSPENVFYTTGFPTLAGSGNPIMYALRNQLPTYCWVTADGRVTLLCWGVATFGVTYGVDEVRPFFTRGFADQELAKLADEIDKGARLGIESTCPYAAADLLNSHAEPRELALCDDVMDAMRLVKSTKEVDRIRRATAIVEQTEAELVPVLRERMSRTELLQEAKSRMIANGAHGIDHVTIGFGAANPEVDLGEPLERNQLVTLDLGAVYAGYVSDNRRYVYTGHAPDSLKELHTGMCGIVRQVGAMLEPGRSIGDLPPRARDLYAAAGHDPLFLNVGHTMGLQVEERWIADGDPTPLTAGMVVNIELYALSETGAFVGDEETYLVTDGAPEQLSKMPPDLIEVDLPAGAG